MNRPKLLDEIISAEPAEHPLVRQMISAFFMRIRPPESISFIQAQHYQCNDMVFARAIRFLQNYDCQNRLPKVSYDDSHLVFGDHRVSISEIDSVRVYWEDTDETLSNKPGAGRYTRLNIRLRLFRFGMRVGDNEFSIAYELESPRSIFDAVTVLTVPDFLHPIIAAVAQNVAAQVLAGGSVRIGGVTIDSRGVEYSKGLLWGKKNHRFAYGNIQVADDSGTSLTLSPTEGEQVKKTLSKKKWNVLVVAPLLRALAESESKQAVKPLTPTQSLEQKTDPVVRLKELKNLHQEGLMTDEEFAEKRKKYLDAL